MANKSFALKPDDSWLAAGKAHADWAHLIKHKDPLVRLRVAMNSNVPANLLEALLDDESLLVRWVAAERPDIDKEIRQNLVINFASDANSNLRMLVAADPRTPLALLRQLAVDDLPKVRACVLVNPSATEDVKAAAVLASDHEESIEGSATVQTMHVWAQLLVTAKDFASAESPRVKNYHNQEKWSIGGRGPGGGFIVFDAGAREWWGQYLEVAPANWAASKTFTKEVSAEPNDGLGSVLRLDPVLLWSVEETDDLRATTGRDIGWGAFNTWGVIQVAGPNSAAWVAASYRGGGLNDWFLPSEAELECVRDSLYKLWKEGEVQVDLADTLDAAGDYYWSSSGPEPDDVSYGVVVNCGSESLEPNDGCRVRPIRAY